MKTCPHCAEEIQEAAVKCRFCGEVLVSPDWRRYCQEYANWSPAKQTEKFLALTDDQKAEFSAAWSALGYDKLPATSEPTRAAPASSSFWKMALAVGCGILLAFVALFFSCTACATTTLVTGLKEATEAKREALRGVDLEGVNCRKDGDWAYVRGKVRNNSSSVVSYVKVGVEWLDGSGKIVDTDWTFAGSAGQALKPGAAVSFETMTRRDSRMSGCLASVLDLNAQ